MKIIIFSLIGLFLVFLLLISLLLSIDRLSSRKSTKSSIPKKITRKTSKAKKIFFNSLFILLLSFISIALVYTSYNINSMVSKKSSTSDKKKTVLDKSIQGGVLENSSGRDYSIDTKTASSKISKETSSKESGSLTTSEQKYSRGQSETAESTFLMDIPSSTQESSTLTTFSDTFTPTTSEFDSSTFLNIMSSSFSKNKDEKESKPIAYLKGAKPGEIFITAFYDQMKNGKFTKSEKIGFSQSENNLCNNINIAINLPSLRKSQLTQLPFTINGSIVPQTSKDLPLELNKKGILKPLKDFKKSEFDYTIKNCIGSPSIVLERKKTEWLTKEIKNIPEELIGFLKAVKEKNSFVKLATVASILNSYFGYQASLEPIELPKNNTWGNLLTEKIALNEKLLCDCDVLSTYSYIFLQYLDFNPILLIGYFNSPKHSESLMAEELHATLLIESDGKWIIFEPTLFVHNFTFEIIKKKLKIIGPVFKGILSTDLTERGIDPESSMSYIIENSEIGYFRIPESISEDLEEINHQSQAEIKLAKLIIEILSFKDNKSKNYNDSGDTTFPIMLLVQSSIVMYFLSIILIKLFAALKGFRRIVFPIDKPFFYIYHLLLFAVFVSILSRSLAGEASAYWSKSTTANFLGITFCLSAGISSAILMIVFLFSDKTETMYSNKLIQSINDRSYLIVGLLFTISALLYSPSNIVFISSLLIIVLFIVEIKKICDNLKIV